MIKNFNPFTDGAEPKGSLIQASNGYLYGITSDGGPGGGSGTIFSLALNGTGFTVIKNNLFVDGNNEGAYPYGSLIQGSDGYLYGQITSSGRFNDRKSTIFKLSADGSGFTILKDFAPSPDRASLQGGLIQTSHGNLYGVISRGEPESEGFIFQLSADGAEFNTIKNFIRSTNGATPIGNLLQAKDGYVYGLTRYGGPDDAGTIFKLSADGADFSVIKYFDRFGGVTDPLGGLIQASDGYLYGMTRQGQTNSGTIFKLAPDGTGFTILKTFISTDGSYPTGRLLEAKDGYLYGLTSGGGPNFGDAGTIFKLALDGSDFTVIKTFNSYVDGTDPIGSLMQGGDDYLYGATQGGGEFNQMKGNIFKIAPDGSDFTILKDFDPSDKPLGGLIEGNDGSLYGTINNTDSLTNNGAIFKLAPDGTGFMVLKTFNQSIEGAPPTGGLIQASDGYLYGTTRSGGPNNGGGTIFKLSADGADFMVIKYFASFADGYNPAGGLLLLKPSCIAPTLGDITAPATPTKIHTLVTTSAQITGETGAVAKATWHWGDQQTTHATLSGTTFSGSHSYQAAGIYTVQLVVEDACGTRVTKEYNSIVIYDPAGGFLTAGTWFHSPAGAYKSKPAASGDAYLLLAAKYKPEATSPSGHTLFHFPSGGITFSSTSYEWLVISGAKASYQGEGRLNGKAGYGFLISAIDGKQSRGGRMDKIRIQIWDKNNNNAIVYDTNLTDTDTDADPSTAIHRGAIVIHTKKANARIDHTYTREDESIREIVAYPNPVTTHLYLDLGVTPAAGVKTLLSDAIGNILLENSHKLAGATLLEIDLSALRPGMYVLRIQSDQGYKTLKVIKQ
ncbi:T9SS type A sorting domain-containing protein [Rhodocytophaga aerolata]|uniref:T9SS type A sorting domain-containing protein n=1 Tax=Rhodocytophaga aerolata TaxID=455078 RepID=A0ABT8RH22_9BACT|nr:choice-of-anchor tandem repeat GloVer-containing protein [Rhodocytophaga aerolata]MDO1451401.1 T9SS type A sorting domain-containing protein [Rhodocytophaga aerolata]